MTRASNAALSIVLAAVLFVCVVIISNYFLGGLQIDLTENRRFTLSEGTVNVLKSLEEPIALRFFFSRELANDYPQIRIYGDRVRDLLREYEARAGGKIDLEVIDPEPFTEAEDRAVALGVAEIPTETGENLYFGLAGTNSVDGRDVIPFFSDRREAFLEYDLTELIYRLSLAEQPKIGLMGDISLELGPAGPQAIMQGQFQPFLIYQELSDTFQIEPVASDADRIPDDIDALIIVHPATFTPKTLYAIDQFVLAGGRVLAFVDSLSEMAQQSSLMSGMPEGPGRSSSLDPLFMAWGVSFDKTNVVADLRQALRVQLDRSAGRPVGDYVAWLGVRGDADDEEDRGLNKDDVVTTDLRYMQIGAAGAFEPVENATTSMTPLIQSTADSMLIDADEVAFSFDPDELIRGFEPTPERYAIAVRVSGPVKSAYPEGPPKEVKSPEESAEDAAENEEDAAADEPDKEALPPHIEASKEDINVILVGDTDLLDDRFWVSSQDFFGQRVLQPTADNGSFVVNAVENLVGSSDLISLRSRGEDKRPLTAIAALEKRAGQRFAAEQVRLEKQLSDTEEQLNRLQSQGADASAAGVLGLTPDEQATIERFRQQMLETRRALREVQRGLRADIDVLENWVQVLNIALMPLVVAAAALGVGFMRRRRRRRRAAGGA